MCIIITSFILKQDATYLHAGVTHHNSLHNLIIPLTGVSFPMSKRRSLFAVLVMLFVLAMVLPAQSQEQITLRWRTRPDNQAEIDVYTAASQSIDAAWDEVALVYEPGGSEGAGYQDVLVTEIEAGTAPDVFWIPGTDIARFAQAGLILNLAEIAAADPDYSESDFYAGPMSFLTTSINEGEPALWGLPRDVSAFAIYYNADLFEEAGLDLPGGENWNWDAFVEAANEISALGDEIYGFGMNAWWANWGYFVNAAGSGFFNEDFTACGLNNPATVAGLETAAGLFASGAAVPWGTDSEPPFLAGNVGMFMNGRWATPGTIANANFNWNVAPLPIGPSGEATNWLFWGAYVVNANTPNPEAAWELVNLLTTVDVQAQVTALGANIPSRVSEEAVQAFLDSTPQLNSAAFTNALANYAVAEAPLWKGDFGQINWNTVEPAIAQVLTGELSPADFTANICGQIEQYFN